MASRIAVLVFALAASDLAEAQPRPDIRAIDWVNRTYDIPDYGRVTIAAGHGGFEMDAGGKIVKSGPEHGWFVVVPPIFLDVDGNGTDDAIVYSLMNTGGTGRYSDITIYTLRGSAIRVLARIPGGDRINGGIEGPSLDGRTLVITRQQGANESVERWRWTGGRLTKAKN